MISVKQGKQQFIYSPLLENENENSLLWVLLLLRTCMNQQYTSNQLEVTVYSVINYYVLKITKTLNFTKQY